MHLLLTCMRRGLHERIIRCACIDSDSSHCQCRLQLRAPLALALAAREVGDRARGCMDGTIASASGQADSESAPVPCHGERPIRLGSEYSRMSCRARLRTCQWNNLNGQTLGAVNCQWRPRVADRPGMNTTNK